MPLYYADKQKGIFVYSDGRIYFTNKGTYELLNSPHIIPFPFKIIIEDELDPYFIAITETGIIFIFCLSDQSLKFSVKLPSNVGNIRKIHLNKDTMEISINSSNGIFVYSNNHWSQVNEPIYTIRSDQNAKIFAQCSQLEMELANCGANKDCNGYYEYASKYLLYLAQYTNPDVFISMWYEVVRESKDLLTVDNWKEILELVLCVDKIQPLEDELLSSINHIQTNN